MNNLKEKPKWISAQNGDYIKVDKIVAILNSRTEGGKYIVQADVGTNVYEIGAYDSFEEMREAILKLKEYITNCPILYDVYAIT